MEPITLESPDLRFFAELGRRFVWLFLAVHAALSLGLWASHLAFPASMGPVTDYTVSISLTGAAAFGGLYAAALSLRDVRRAPSSPAP